MSSLRVIFWVFKLITWFDIIIFKYLSNELNKGGDDLHVTHRWADWEVRGYAELHETGGEYR